MNSSQHTQFSPDQVRYLTYLMVLDKTTLSPSGGLVVDGDVTIPPAVTAIKYPVETVSGDCFCYHADITSLQNAPQYVGGYFTCSHTAITTLDGAPLSVGADCNCSYIDITSLNGAPQSVGGSFYCHGTKIKSLKGIHKTHRNWKIGGILYLPDDCADIVGLALIEGISQVYINKILFDISDHDPHTFQEKLLDAGMKAQARM